MDIFTKRIVSIIVVCTVLAALLVGNIFAYLYRGIISDFLVPEKIDFQGEYVQESRALADELVRKISDDGIVLLKNINDCLPLKADETKLNVFGWRSSDQGFLLRGIGSGSSTIRDEAKITLLDALEEGGFEVNEELVTMYNQHHSGEPSSAYELVEKPVSTISQSVFDNAKEFSDIALMVVSRNGGENIGEIPKTQSKRNGSGSADSTRTHLQFSKEEEDLMAKLGQEFEKVIVILNTANYMQPAFLDNSFIDAAMFVGLTGQSGTMGIVHVLKGITQVAKYDDDGELLKDDDGKVIYEEIEFSPSGKLTDIIPYDPKNDPTWFNNTVTSSSIQYQEDIYYGYKWYETADFEGYFDGEERGDLEGYDAVVQYPFGFGLSYTTFDWEISRVNIPNGGSITKDSKIVIDINVKNTGDRAGKDVIQVYFTPPYTEGGIEKAYVNLVGFEKTSLLPPGETEVITIEIDPYYMASYDCYDRNENQFAGWELEKGVYEIKFMTDSHNLKDVEGLGTDKYLTYVVDETIKFENDPHTGTKVENKFTGSTAYANVPIDGSTVGAETQYMTRADFEGTFPTQRAKTPNNSTAITNASRYIYDGFDTDVLPTTGSTDTDHKIVQKKTASGQIVNATKSELEGNLAEAEELVVNFDLVKKLKDYDDPIWEELLNQISAADMLRIVESSGFGSIAIESVGKVIQYDKDGPAGFNRDTTGAGGSWTAYPSETLIGCTWNRSLLFEMGLSMGFEAKSTGINGWYAPGVNLHRSPYTARNFEYYSEDGFLSGKLAAELIFGCKINGLYTFIKHYVVSEPGPNPRNVNTWLTEQNLRENYLRPFELAVKEGGTVALMTAFNRVGAVWAGACKPLNIDILRDEWGFRGVVLTDWSTGEGLGGMNPKQGVRAGNDMWLNPNVGNGSPLSRQGSADYPTDLTLARQATKNCLYAYVSSYYLSETFDRSEIDARFNRKIGIIVPVKAFEWWIPVVGVIDLLALAGSAVWIYFLYKPKKLVG